MSQRDKACGLRLPQGEAWAFARHACRPIDFVDCSMRSLLSSGITRNGVHPEIRLRVLVLSLNVGRCGQGRRRAATAHLLPRIWGSLIAAREEAKVSQRTRCPASDLGRHCTTNTRSGAGRQGLSMSREAVQNLNQRIQLGPPTTGPSSAPRRRCGGRPDCAIAVIDAVTDKSNRPQSEGTVQAALTRS